MSKVLVISAHSDDETLGCHYATARHIRQGDSVTVLLMTSDELRKQECRAALSANTAFHCKVNLLTANDFSSVDFLADGKLDSQIPFAATAIAEVMACLEPDIVYVHSRYEPSSVPDHRAVYDALLIAAAKYSKHFVLYEYPVWQYASWPYVSLPRLGKKSLSLWLSQVLSYLCRSAFSPVRTGKGKYYNVIVRGDSELKRKAMSCFKSQLPGLKHVASGRFLHLFYKQEVFHKSRVN